MALLMSFALTEPQIVARTKLVTRRLGWPNLRAGSVVQPVRKRMGLKLGETVTYLADPLTVKSVRREPLRALLDDLDYGFEELVLEGFGDHPRLRWPQQFVWFFCETHRPCTPDAVVTRIEFEGDRERCWWPSNRLGRSQLPRGVTGTQTPVPEAATSMA